MAQTLSLEGIATTLVLALSALCVQLQGQTPSYMPTFTADQAKHAISDWKEENKSYVEIDKDATRDVQKSITGPESHTGTGTKVTDSTDDFVVSSYLFELRDRKCSEMKTCTEPISNASSRPDQKIKLGQADVHRFSYADYTAQIGPSILLEPGELIVESVPSGASIDIDGQSRGMTPKDFIVSRGKHTVSVKLNKPCTGTVDVQSDLVTYSCPPKK